MVLYDVSYCCRTVDSCGRKSDLMYMLPADWQGLDPIHSEIGRMDGHRKQKTENRMQKVKIMVVPLRIS